MKIGFGYDSHRMIEGRKFILGGVEIPNEKGPSGHSDADVLVHAICDAILGAIGKGDIGTNFPDTDDEFKDISSLIILRHVCFFMDEAGFRIKNVDSTIVLEKPKLAKYIPNMVKLISAVLNIPEDTMSIKAKTNEGMGLIGQNDGIAAFAVVLLERKDY